MPYSLGGGADVVVIGAGLAGLTCAKRLQEAGVSVLILEASKTIGGALNTDYVEGFILDRGFQVFLTSYPETWHQLDFEQLHLKPFMSGVVIRRQGRFCRWVDPWHHPLLALETLVSPLATWQEKQQLMALRWKLCHQPLDGIWLSRDISTLQYLKDIGFSENLIDVFFKPFWGGVFLDPTLRTSSRIFEFTFRMFAQGKATLPQQGMAAIPRQLAESLSSDQIWTDMACDYLEEGGIIMQSREKVRAKSIVIATAPQEAFGLLGFNLPISTYQVTTLYFSAPKPPFKHKFLVLNGEGSGPVNHLCILSNIAPSYAPSGESLISVTALGTYENEHQLKMNVLNQLESWYGKTVRSWRHLRTYAIHQTRSTSEIVEKMQLPPHVYVCSEHWEYPSINGAMASGRRIAETILADFKKD